MPICSYLVYAQPGQLSQAAERIAALPQCEVKQADGGEMLIAMTATETDEEEKALQERFKEIEEIDCMVMTFGAMAEEAVL